MKNLFLAIVLLCAFKANASHIASAEIFYRPNTSTLGSYIVTLVLIKACEPASLDLSTAESIVVKAATSFEQWVSLPMISGPDTLGSYCPGNFNSCIQPASLLPGFERRVYSDTINLLFPDEYTFSWTACCRPGGIANILNPTGESIYVKATLNHVGGFTWNSSAWLPDPNPLWITQGVMNTFPLHAIDAENDSLVYELFQPLSGTYSFPSLISYASGFSLTSPLGAGGILTINPNNTLTIMAPTAGKFALGIRIKDYQRSTGVLMGESMRDFTVVAMPSAISVTPPLPSAGTSLHHNTCPGQANSITLSFTDPVPTDSVFLTVGTPTIPGYTFNTVVSSGPGSATATISWATPITLNPASLPVFYFSVVANDNACPVRASANYAVAVYTGSCPPDSVWAGDANGDYIVNQFDPLAVAVAYGKAGPVRPFVSTKWVARYCAPWADSFSHGVNFKHADCTGDGIVNNLELPIISTNWGQVHLKPEPKPKTSGLPELYFDISGISFIPGTTVSIPIKMGTTANPATTFYGVGSSISIGGLALASPATITYSNSWLGTTANTLQFTKTIDNGTLGWAYARIDQQHQSGEGEIARLNFDIPSNTPSGLLTLSFNGTKTINSNMADLQVADLDTSVMIWALTVDEVNTNIIQAAIVPNPSAWNATLQLTLTTHRHVTISIIDPVGKAVQTFKLDGRQGQNNMTLPDNLSAGLYLLSITDGDKMQPLVLKWLKH